MFCWKVIRMKWFWKSSWSIHRFHLLQFLNFLIYPSKTNWPTFQDVRGTIFPKKLFIVGLSLVSESILFFFLSEVECYDWHLLISSKDHTDIFLKKIIDLSSLWVICYHFLGLRVFQMWNDDRSIRFFLNQKPLAIKIKCSEQQYRV